MHIQLSNKVLNTVMQNNQLLEFLFFTMIFIFLTIYQKPSSPGHKGPSTNTPLTRYVDKLIVNTYCKF